MCGSVNDLTRISQAELAAIDNKYSETEDGPRMHPIVTLVAEEWSRAAGERRDGDLNSIRLADAVDRCGEVQAEHPLWCPELFMKDLRLLVMRVSADDMWWLPPAQVNRETGGNAGM